MRLFQELFGKKKELTSLQRVRGIMKHFIEASHVGLDRSRVQTSQHGQLYFTYMFGAVDMLCQAHPLGERDTVSLFHSLLQEELGGFASDEGKQLTQVVIQTSANPYGQESMREGGNAARKWIGGEVLAPHRLQELLSALDH